MINRGFHRIGVFLACTVFLLSIGVTVFVAVNEHDTPLRHKWLVCARDKLRVGPSEGTTATDIGHPLSEAEVALPYKLPPGYVLTETQDLKALGCTDYPETVSTKDALNESDGVSWIGAFLSLTSLIVFATGIGLSLAVYGVIHAVGWVITGFAHT